MWSYCCMCKYIHWGWSSSPLLYNIYVNLVVVHCNSPLHHEGARLATYEWVVILCVYHALASCLKWLLDRFYYSKLWVAAILSPAVHSKTWHFHMRHLVYALPWLLYWYNCCIRMLDILWGVANLVICATCDNCVCVCACVRVCVRACVRACVHVSIGVCMTCVRLWTIKSKQSMPMSLIGI